MRFVIILFLPVFFELELFVFHACCGEGISFALVVPDIQQLHADSVLMPGAVLEINF